MNKSALSMFKNCAIEFNSTKCYEVSHASETPCWEQEFHACPAREAFESGQITRAIHKHKTEPDEIVHEVISTPVFGKEGEVLYVIEEYHSSVQEFRGILTVWRQLFFLSNDNYFSRYPLSSIPVFGY